MPPGDRQRSVRSDRSLMLGVLCIACYFRVCASRMFHACNTPSSSLLPIIPIASPHRANFRKAPRGVRLHYRLTLSEREHVRRKTRARTWHRFAKCSLRLSPVSIPFKVPRYGSGGLNDTASKGPAQHQSLRKILGEIIFCSLNVSKFNFPEFWNKNIRSLLHYNNSNNFYKFRSQRHFQYSNIPKVQVPSGNHHLTRVFFKHKVNVPMTELISRYNQFYIIYRRLIYAKYTSIAAVVA